VTAQIILESIFHVATGFFIVGVSIFGISSVYLMLTNWRKP